jgi:predicted ATP-grasp superfamily ATP-dependent carboligase
MASPSGTQEQTRVSVLVTPGDLRSALAVTRSLGRQGIAVTIADERRRSLAGASRYCRESIRIPSGAESPQLFVREILRALEGGRHRVVMPVDDIALSLLARDRHRFEDLVTLPFPDSETIRSAHDKGALAALAEDHGIPVPRTTVVRNSGDLDMAVRRIGFPAVVKARVSRLSVAGQWRSAPGTRYVNTPAELEAACQEISGAIPDPIVQEYVPGEGRGIFLLMNRGQLRAAFAHRRLREKPPSGGISVLSESVAPDPRLLEHAERILEALKWHGVAMVEFKHDARDGVGKLLEINGRFWGSLQLAVDAGIDFPHLLYRLAVEGDVKPVLTYDVGIRLRWSLGNVDWLLLRLRDSHSARSRVQAVMDFVRSLSMSRTRDETLRRDDPGPGVAELGQYVGHAMRSAGRMPAELIRNKGR